MTQSLNERSGHVARIHHHRRIVKEGMAAIVDQAARAAAEHYAGQGGHGDAQTATPPGSVHPQASP